MPSPTTSLAKAASFPALDPRLATKLAAALDESADTTIFVNGTALHLPDTAHAALIEVLHRMSRGDEVSISTVESLLNTSQAAQMAGIFAELPAQAHRLRRHPGRVPRHAPPHSPRGHRCLAGNPGTSLLDVGALLRRARSYNSRGLANATGRNDLDPYFYRATLEGTVDRTLSPRWRLGLRGFAGVSAGGDGNGQAAPDLRLGCRPAGTNHQSIPAIEGRAVAPARRVLSHGRRWQSARV